MVFSSTVFIFFFLPIVLAGYYLVRVELRNIWLLFFSLIFFSWSQPKYAWIIVVSIIINYIGGLLVNRATKRKLFMSLIIVLNLGLLFYYKYFNFSISILEDITHNSFNFKTVILPIGISFFTFQGMSYVIDVYRKDVPVQKSIINIALYITLFPQLIAGPIVRYSTVSNEIGNRECNLDDFVYGIKRFILGLFKKVVIANAMATTADSIFNNSQISQGTAWIGIVAYTLQIYFDFSGYSDMAIGLGRLFGFHFLENFNYPYISKSITEFWRRWHISLSTWFKDYVYIPLGGNRKRVYINLGIVFFLTGLWHGAAWNFIFWGIWHGCFILVERFFRKNMLTSEKFRPNT